MKMNAHNMLQKINPLKDPIQTEGFLESYHRWLSQESNNNFNCIQGPFHVLIFSIMPILQMHPNGNGSGRGYDFSYSDGDNKMVQYLQPNDFGDGWSVSSRYGNGQGNGSGGGKILKHITTP